MTAGDGDRTGPRILLLAGEASGDRYAAGIVHALRRLEPSADVRAMGGAQVRGAGADLVVDSTELAVVGITEVLGRLPALLRARSALLSCLETWRPHVVVPVDYPDFNVRIARAARRRGSRVAWFISPQAWAWRPGRLPGFRTLVDRMLVILPFEAELYRRHGVPVEHVGHPLMERAAPSPSKEEARDRLALPAGGPVVAFLPGSRRSEVRRTWPVLARAADLVARGEPGLRVVVPLAPGLDPSLLSPSPSAPVTVARGAMEAAVAACDAAVVASGTATLETALARRALVVVYRVSRPTMALSRWLADAEFLSRGIYALPNLVLGERVVPELYQERFTADRVAAEVLTLLQDAAARDAQLAQLERLHELLGGPGTSERVARAVLELARTTSE